jgi:hypothetical protein
VLILAQLVFTLAAPSEDWANFVSIVLQAAILGAAVIAAHVPRTVARFAWALIAAVVIGSAVAMFSPAWEIGTEAPTLITVGLVVLAPLVIVYGVVRSLRVERTITLHAMWGVLGIYLLLGYAFALAFQAIGEFDTGQFFAGGTEESTGNFLYFAFVTMTTVGYGDLAPVSGIGRAFAIALALTGQIYLVTVVAIIVSNLGARRGDG